MRIAFRADASLVMGSGHVMRCLTLATAMRARRAEVMFVCREHSGHLIDHIEAQGFPVIRLRSLESSDQKQMVGTRVDYASWLGADWLTDAQETMEALKVLGQIDWLAVDHYAIDRRWESALRRITKRILVIDDLANRQHDCDLLLDQNLYQNMGTRYTERIPTHCQLLLGPRFAILRDEFRTARERMKSRDGLVRRVLVFFGGADVGNYTYSAVETLARIGAPGLHVDVVVGLQHPWLEQIKVVCLRYGFLCHVQTDRMAELMADADLAVGSGGSAIWEQCCMGLPALVFAVAENQREASEALAGAGVALLGRSENLAADIEHAVGGTLAREYRHDMSVRAAGLVDGQGLARVSEFII